MTVYFIYRCYYNSPGERHVRKFERNTVVDWVRSIWKPIPEEEKAHQYAADLLGGLDVGVFGSMFLAIAEERLPPPENMDQFLEGFCNAYVEEEDHGPHHLQILTEDDDNQVAVYLFDDHFRALAPGLTDFLLLDGWELPGTWSDTRLPWLPRSARLAHSSAAEGAVYAVRLFTDCRSTLEDLDGGVQVQGIRVPDRCRYLLTHSDEEDLDYGLQFIRGPLQDLLAAPVGEDAGFLAEMRDNPGEEVHWNVYSDWLEERGQPPAGLYLLEVALRAEKFAGALENRSPALDRVKVTPHMAQACKHEGRWAHDSFRGPSPRESYTQWIFFDDRWLSAHPTLATGILQVAAHWDVLSTRPREGGDILS